MDVMASMLIPSATTSDAQGAEKKKAKGAKKTTQKGKKSKSKAAASAGMTSKDASPLCGQQAIESTSHPVGGVVIIDDSSPQRGDVHHESTQEAPVVDSGPPTELTIVAAPPAKSVSVLGSGSTIPDESTAGPTSSSRPHVESDSWVPFHHSLSEIGKQRWMELRSRLIGKLEEGYSPVEDPPVDDRFVPSRFLHKEDSVFRSGRSQIAAIKQFSLPRDLDLVKDVPSSGLRMALQSYHTRAALASKELYKHLHLLNQVRNQLDDDLVKEREVRENAERRIASLEAELDGINVKWELELEKKQSTISQLQTHYAKQSDTIMKLKEEVTKNKQAAEKSQLDAADSERRAESLERELDIEKQARASAEEKAHSDQFALQSMKAELDDLKTARQAALADVASLKAQLDFMSSAEGKKEIIEAYRLGPIGKAELTLAVKAGFDYLKAQLPQSDGSSSSLAYPPLVGNSLPMLLELEKKGAGVRLDADTSGGDEEDDDNEEDEDEDSNGDGSN